jgi:phage tail-like protein
MSGCSNGQVNFFVLDTAAAWTGSQAGGNVSIGAGGLALPVSTDYATAQVVQATQFPAKLTVKSMAPAACGIVYLLDEACHEVWTYDSNRSLFNRVPAIHGLLTAPVAIAHQSGTLFVADTGNVCVFALALLTGQIRWSVGANVASADGTVKLSGFAPVALVPGPHGDLYALDNNNSVVLHFDWQGQLLESLGITAQGANLTAIARARDATLYVLVGTQKILQRVPQGTFTDFLPAAGTTSLNAASLAVDSNGTIYIGEPSSSGSSSGGSTGLNTGIISRFDPSGNSLGSLPAYSGFADRLAADCTDNLYAQQAGPTLSLLESASSYLVPANTPPLQANYTSTAFDSGTAGTVWHRLVIDADLPANTQLLVYFYASDQSSDDPTKSTTNKWLPPLLNSTDALLIDTSNQNSPVTGRYLWLMLTLVGTESATPLVRSIRIYFPRVSYLRYLPAIYSQDPTSRDFLQRFLSIFESIFSGLETKTTNLVRYFDPRVVTGEFLQWLAQWLAISVDNTWTDDQLRTLLLEAPDLFRERGTPAQIAEVVRIYLGIAPFIIEQFQLACAQSSDIQQLYDNLYGSGAFCFCLLVPPYQQLGTAAKGTTTTYADTDKAAVIAGNCIELVLGSHTYEIPLKGRNTLDGLRDAINGLGVGVVAEVLSGPARTSYSLDSSGQWIGPGGVTDETSAPTTGSTPPAYYLELRAKRIGPRDLELRTTAGVKSTNILQSNDSGSYMVVSPWSQENRDALQRILDQEKPAHTCGGIQVLQPRILLDMHSYLEVNSWLVKPSPMLDTGASMPLDSVVDDATPIGQAGVHARIGLDTVLG